jgi:DNA-binding CsgD family transcriptional regulator
VFFDFKEPRRKPLTMSEDLSLEVLNAIRTSAFFEQAVEMDGRFQWEIRKILERNGKRSILCGRLIKRTDGERNLGVIALLLRTERFAEIINNDLYVDGEPSEGAVGNYYNLMISREGFILASPIKHHTGRHISEVMGKTKILAEALSSGRITGVFKADWKDGSVYLRIQPVHDSGILLLEVSTRPVGSILSLLSILVGAVLLAAGGGLAYRSRLIALPPESIGDGPSVSEEDLKHFKALPRRESEILLLISEGLSNKEIAYRLQLREQTVKNYIRSIYEKLGIHDRVSAALLISKIKNIRKIINNPE